jgi:hypothetical protein
MKDHFGNTIEKDGAPQYLNGKKVFEMVQKVKIKHGKKSLKRTQIRRRILHSSLRVCHSKKLNIFQYLDYWPELAVRHAIDGMHLEKNVFKSTIGFLDLLSKKKDSLKSRFDLVELGIRPELHPTRSWKWKKVSSCG